MTGSAATTFEFDPFSIEVMADPDRYYKLLRDRYPGYYSQQYDTYFFSRFADVWEVLRVGNNTFVATEGNLPTPEYLRSTATTARHRSLASIPWVRGRPCPLLITRTCDRPT